MAIATGGTVSPLLNPEYLQVSVHFLNKNSRSLQGNFSFLLSRCLETKLWVWLWKTSRLMTSVRSARCRSPKMTPCCWREVETQLTLRNGQQRSPSSWRTPPATTRRRNSMKGWPSCLMEWLCSRYVSNRSADGAKCWSAECSFVKIKLGHLCSIPDWRNEWCWGEWEEGPCDRCSERHQGSCGGGDCTRWRLCSAALHPISR